MEAIESTFTTSDNCRLCVKKFPISSRGKVSCVFVHGLTGDQAAWEFVIEALASNALIANIYTFDLRLHGQSEHRYPQNQHLILRCAEDLRELIDQRITIDRSGPLLLVGHSFGSIVVQEYVRRYPNKRVIGTILISAPDHSKGFLLPTYISKFFFKFPNAIQMRTRTDHARYLGTWDIDLRRLWSDITSLGLAHFLSVYATTFGWTVKAGNTRFPTPVLVIGGRRDVIFSPSEMIVFATKIGAQFFEVYEGNHCLPTSNAKEVATHIQLFTDSCLSEPPRIGYNAGGV